MKSMLPPSTQPTYGTTIAAVRNVAAMSFNVSLINRTSSGLTLGSSPPPRQCHVPCRTQADGHNGELNRVRSTTPKVCLTVLARASYGAAANVGD
jgi:hypothetical protein